MVEREVAREVIWTLKYRTPTLPALFSMLDGLMQSAQ